MPRELSWRAKQRLQARASARALEKEREAKRATALGVIAKRLARRCPGLAPWLLECAAREVYSLRHDHRDYLAGRCKPEVFRGWRKDFPRHAAYLGIDDYPSGHGLPLAHEGGSPPHPRDEPTFELARANGSVLFAAEMKYILATRDIRNLVVRLDA